FVAFDRERFVSSLIEVAVSNAVPIKSPASYMRGGQALHELAELAILLGPQQQVPVVRHQAPRQQSQRSALQRFVHNPQEGQIVGVGFEDWPPFISTIEDMKDVAAGCDACSSGHRCNLRRKPRTVNNWTYPLFFNWLYFS